jgi:hypothetical protein
MARHEAREAMVIPVILRSVDYLLVYAASDIDVIDQQNFQLLANQGKN